MIVIPGKEDRTPHAPNSALRCGHFFIRLPRAKRKDDLILKRKKQIPFVTRENGSPEALRAMDAHEARGLHLTNMKRTILNNVPVFEAVTDVMSAVNDQLQGKIPQRALTFFLYAISSGNHCMVCGTYFKKMVVDMGVEDFDTFQFTEEEEDLIAFANALTCDPNNIPDEIYEKLQARYDDETMVVLVLNAVFTQASNLFNNIVGVELDEELKPYYQEDEGCC